jgi:hypothetical protein
VLTSLCSHSVESPCKTAIKNMTQTFITLVDKGIQVAQVELTADRYEKIHLVTSIEDPNLLVPRHPLTEKFSEEPEPLCVHLLAFLIV